MVLYRCKESYTITVKDEDGAFLWNFNNFPVELVGNRQGEAYSGAIPFAFKPYEIPLDLPDAKLFSVYGFDDPSWLGYPLDIHLCFANDNGMQSIKLIPMKAVSFEVIEDSDTCNIIRHTYDDKSYFEILLGSREQKPDTDTIWLHIMNVYTE